VPKLESFRFATFASLQVSEDPYAMLQEEFKAQQQKVAAMREEMAGQLASSAFVTFPTVQAATIASMALHTMDTRAWKCLPAPPPSDIDWSGLNARWPEKQVREPPHRLAPLPRPLTNQHGSHRQRGSADIMMLPSSAHADMTTLRKVDANCTAPSLIPTVNGDTVRSFSTHEHQSAAKGARPLSHALTSDLYNILTSRLCGLMVRRWRLIGYFPILCNPSRARCCLC
jgi:hypothetical protein